MILHPSWRFHCCFCVSRIYYTVTNDLRVSKVCYYLISLLFDEKLKKKKKILVTGVQRKLEMDHQV